MPPPLPVLPIAPSAVPITYSSGCRVLLCRSSSSRWRRRTRAATPITRTSSTNPITLQAFLWVSHSPLCAPARPRSPPSHWLSPHRLCRAPLDWISYHRYATPNSRTDLKQYELIFDNYDDFFSIVAHIEGQRKALSPTTRTTIDEIGVILPNDNDDNAEPFPLVYWNACAASFAYLFGNLALQGIDVLGSSQLVGNPRISQWLGGLEPQYPSVSMVNWTTGVGTARVWLLQLLEEEFKVGDGMVETAVNGSAVYAQGWTRKVGTGEERRVLMVNKKSVRQVVTYPEAVGGESRTVDERSGETPARREKIGSATITLAPFAVTVLRLPSQGVADTWPPLKLTLSAE